jgi:pyruvate,orthophosphate dikinase
MKFVYRFSKEQTDGDGSLRNTLGGKGAGLAEMCKLGVPVPPGFTITTEACLDYLKQGRHLRDDIRQSVEENITWLEGVLNKQLGAAQGMPLLLSVRSGARASMPGMMDTILNLGLNSATVETLAEQSGDRRFAFDSYRRFIQMYGNVVLGLDHSEFEMRLERIRDAEGVNSDAKISAEGLEKLVASYKEYVLEETDAAFPEDPKEQLWGAIYAVFNSWDNPRAKFYRKINDIPESCGTAVNVQSMVFGNMGMRSGTGVCFSRNPSTGENRAYGEYLINAQGEDVVAGIRTPNKIDAADDPDCMKATLPKVFDQLMETLGVLEKHFGDMQDTEFTIENDELFLLQTRSGKRTSRAGLQIAIDLFDEGLIDEIKALKMIDPNAMMQLLASEFDMDAKDKLLQDGALLGTGLNAGPGAATGVVTLCADKAVTLEADGQSVILVREETSPEDIAGMHAAVGILTQRGGMTSHAAVVARGMGKPCVVGCTDMIVNEKDGYLRFGNRTIREGENLSIDGTTGEVLQGTIPTRESVLIQELKDSNPPEGGLGSQFQRLMVWVEKYTKMTVRTNADTAEDASLARLLGAKGIGLCRTEHMFFGEDRILNVRRMILAPDQASQQEALNNLLPYQINDFYELFKAMDGLPVTIRLLDPPLHEFLPHNEQLIEGVAKSMRLSMEEVRIRIKELEEQNPMLGHRGCRLGISHPSIYKMQVSAIVEAAKRAKAEGCDVKPEIMVPLIITQKELDCIRDFIQPILKEAGFDFPVGTMIEIPRAALTAGEIAKSADFFSFGTNDLTQCGMGISRDDSGSFLPQYLDSEILDEDPFKSIDQTGIGRLVQIAAEDGRATKPDMKLGVCGEHGGDPKSIQFFFKTGLDYVSCSPYRVPVAKLAAVKASLEG